MPPQDNQTLAAMMKSQVIAQWEHFSIERLAVTRKTLKQFKAGPLPAAVRVSARKRRGSKITRRSPRGFQNTSSFLALWPDDHQAIFRFPTLAFVVQGQADFPVADYIVHCPQNHFLLFADDVPRPTGGQPHLDGENRRQRHCAVLWFFAPPGTNSVTAYVCHSQNEKHWFEPYHIVHCPEAIPLFQLALRELQREAPQREAPQRETEHDRLIATLSLQTFLRVFARELEAGRFHQAGKSSAPDTLVSGASPISQAQEYVKTHLQQSLTAHHVARQVYMSRNNFMQHFRQQTGQTFHDYVTAQRMEEAERLLRDGDWALSFICSFIGLRPTQFRAQFKKHSGLTPSEFRHQQHKKGQNR